MIDVESKSEKYTPSAVSWAEMNTKNKGMRDKRVSLEEAAQIIGSGCHVALGGTQYNRVPIAIVRELIRAGKENLTVSRSLMSFEADFLLVAGVMKTAVTSWLSGAVTYGLSPMVRLYMENNRAKFEEWSNLAMGLRYMAGAMGISCIPAKVVLGSDIARLVGLKTMECPYTGDKLALIPALNPDVAVIHAQRADQFGNVQIDGMTAMDTDMAKAAKKVIVTVEKIVPNEEIRRTPELTRIPFFCVDAVVEVPYGAFPYDCYGCYEPVHEHFRGYYQGFETAKSPEENTRNYIEKYFMETKSFEDYLALFGVNTIIKYSMVRKS
ncbi:MAG: CoA transferase subunit A [Deltaproteobacteria bacterium]|nr:CoA transferase subunit A [Deltaproteobacteria bacterium]